MNLSSANKQRENKTEPLMYIIIIIHIVVCTVFFFCFRQGFHSDEIWNYGLANSIGQPHFYAAPGVYIDDVTADDWINYNKWITGKTFNDYITIQKGEQFDLIGVYKNMSLDHHPFMYFWLLNIISSFMPDKFSVVPAFLLQMVFLVFSQIYLYKTGKLILREKKWSPLILCLFYAVGQGGMVTFSFIRQYSLLTMLILMHLYYQIRLLKSDGFDIKKYMLPVAVTALLGLLTHYYMVAAAFGATLMICLYLLFHKEFKKMFAYGFSMVGVILSFLIIWPFALRNLQSGNGSYKSYPFETQFKIALADTLKSISGLTFDAMRSAAYSYVVAAVVLLTAIAVPLCYLFRKETWFIEFKREAKEKAVTLFKNRRRLFEYSYIIIAVIIFVYIAIITKTVDIFRMGEAYKRYLFAIMPLLSIFIIGVSEYIVIHLPHIKKAVVPIMLVISLGGAVYSQTMENPFIVAAPGKMTQMEAEAFFEGKDVQLAIANYSLPIYISHFMHKADDIRIITHGWYKTHSIEEFDPELDDFYFILADQYGRKGNIYDPEYQYENPIPIDDQKNIEFKMDEGMTEEQKNAVENSIIGYDYYTLDETQEMFDYFNSGEYKAEWVDDLVSNGLLLKIFHVTRTSPQSAAETK